MPKERATREGQQKVPPRGQQEVPPRGQQKKYRPEGSKKYRLGSLNRLDLRKLLSIIEDCLQKYGTCGIQITEHTSGSGALYKDAVHGVRVKSAARRRRGIHVL